MEKQINNNSSHRTLITDDNILLDSGKYHKSFNVQIISNDHNLVKTTMNFDDENNRVIFITEEKTVIIKVKSKEILGFVPPEYVDEDFRYKHRAVMSSANTDFKLALFNFYPRFEFNRCNCCGWVCCNCTETVSCNKAKVSYLINNLLEYSNDRREKLNPGN